MLGDDVRRSHNVKIPRSRRDVEKSAKRALEEIRRRELERTRRNIESVRKEEARQLAQSLKEKNILKVDVEVCAIH